MIDPISSSSPSNQLIRITPFLLIFFLLIPLYSNSFNADWQMDDRPNIIDNPSLRINDLMPRTLWETFFANQGKEPGLYRPLPCLTFALNWYVGQDNPWGYHLVNFVFHTATAWVLYLMIINLLALLNHSCRHDQTRIRDIALLATAMWAIHPIQTQAVTYIVQRMAIMAAFFYVLGILFFVKSRCADTAYRRWVYGIVCLLCFTGGMGSKENAVLLPASLLLVEWIFFQQGRIPLFFRPKIISIGIFFCISLFLAVHFTYGLPFHYILNGYDARPFTLTERVMTQPRIILMYLSQIAFPLPERLSIAHDVALSTSFLTPWTTVPAMTIVMGCIVAALKSVKPYPLLSFAVLFYFLNHIVESTVFPLELIFEHRNYLPSLFLFLPISAGIYNLMMRLRQYSSFLNATVAGIVIVIIVGLGIGTHIRNKAWATSESLWRDAVVKAPNNIRPLVNLGIQLAWQDRPTPANFRHALVLFQYGLDFVPNRSMEKAEILGNMASVYFHQGLHDKAIALYHQAIEVDPIFLKNRSDLVKPLLMTGRFEEAAQQARYLISARPDNPDYLNLLGFVLLWQKEYEQALTYFQKAMAKGQINARILLNLGMSLTLTGHWDRGYWFLRRASQKSPGDPVPLFAIIENRIRAGDYDVATHHAQKIVSSFPLSSVSNTLNALDRTYVFAPISVELVKPALRDAIAFKLSELKSIE